MGFYGAAVTINSPNLEQASDIFTVFSKNNFLNNFAYMSGGAIYMRNTKTVKQYHEVCAGGIIIDS